MSKFGTVQVAGNSMLPAYRDGDWLFVSWIGNSAALERVARALVGKVVVVEREERPGIFLVKRAKKFDNAKFWVEGDAAESTDSRTWGWISPEEIVGVVLFKIPRLSKNQKTSG